MAWIDMGLDYEKGCKPDDEQIDYSIRVIRNHFDRHGLICTMEMIEPEVFRIEVDQLSSFEIANRCGSIDLQMINWGWVPSMECSDGFEQYQLDFLQYAERVNNQNQAE